MFSPDERLPQGQRRCFDTISNYSSNEGRWDFRLDISVFPDFIIGNDGDKFPWFMRNWLVVGFTSSSFTICLRLVHFFESISGHRRLNSRMSAAQHRSAPREQRNGMKPHLGVFELLSPES